MGAAVDAIGYKADVPARTKDAVSEKVDSLRSRITGAGSQLADAAPDTQDIKQGAGRAIGVAEENPLGLAVGAAAVGFLAGMLLPSTRVEDERLGPVADQVKEQARHTGQEALEQGKQVVQETAQTASEKVQEAASDLGQAAKDSGEEHARELSDTARESAARVQESATR
jgi:gas vesicle protein